jgi:tRNA threonylcarbamoyladenosine modification (KEOPS) complex  Pcc1 subunit
VSAESGWAATIEIRLPSAAGAVRLARSLAPESTREVPRATARVDRPGPTVVRVTISARDTGALRAAINTHLGWVQLALATERRVAPP